MTWLPHLAPWKNKPLLLLVILVVLCFTCVLSVLWGGVSVLGHRRSFSSSEAPSITSAGFLLAACPLSTCLAQRTTYPLAHTLPLPLPHHSFCFLCPIMARTRGAKTPTKAKAGATEEMEEEQPATTTTTTEAEAEAPAEATAAPSKKREREEETPAAEGEGNKKAAVEEEETKEEEVRSCAVWSGYDVWVWLVVPLRGTKCLQQKLVCSMCCLVPGACGFCLHFALSSFRPPSYSFLHIDLTSRPHPPSPLPPTQTYSPPPRLSPPRRKEEAQQHHQQQRKPLRPL